MPLNHNTSNRPKPRLLCTATPQIPHFPWPQCKTLKNRSLQHSTLRLFGVRGLHVDHSRSLAHGYFDQTEQMRLWSRIGDPMQCPLCCLLQPYCKHISMQARPRPDWLLTSLPGLEQGFITVSRRYVRFPGRKVESSTLWKITVEIWSKASANKSVDTSREEAGEGMRGKSRNLGHTPRFPGTFVVVIRVTVVKATARREAAGWQSNSCSFTVTSGDKSVHLRHRANRAERESQQRDGETCKERERERENERK